jgi:alpha-acetolactate decarboxylase
MCPPLPFPRRAVLPNGFRPRPLALAAATLALCAVAAAADGFEVTAFGNISRAHAGDTSGQVSLNRLPQDPGHWGVGALAGLQGEVLLFDGRLLVSRGTDPQGRVSALQGGDEAALFAAARVQQWAAIAVPTDMGQQQFEAFVLRQADERGITPGTAFPFIVQGRYPLLRWHVVTGPATAHRGGHGAGHAPRHASPRVFEQPDAAGYLVGIHAGTRLEGVVSHPGERFHLHYADDALTLSGHVDAYAVARGAVLKLPLR